MGTARHKSETPKHPIDLFERIATGHDWTWDRAMPDELTLVIPGTWTQYHVSLNWRPDMAALHMACAFDFKCPPNRVKETYRLVGQINEQLWLGHFDVWTEEGLVMYRHALPLNGTTAVPAQCEAMLHAALDACERYFQAFQFVVWAGKPSREALASVMFETEGQA